MPQPVLGAHRVASPLVDLRKGVQGEQTMVAAELRAIRDEPDDRMPRSKRSSSRLSGVISFSREQSGQPPAQRASGSACRGEGRRRRLRGAAAAGAVRLQGRDGRQVPAVAAHPCWTRSTGLSSSVTSDLKLLCVPVWQVELRNSAQGRPTGSSDRRWRDLLPNIEKLRAEEAELERQVALLRYVEALRLYAAAHDGKLPAKPADISLPLPLDPVTGKPFDYSRRRDDGAHSRRLA